jgi:membrane-associated protease RseP (regulator of RpoE activity)
MKKVITLFITAAIATAAMAAESENFGGLGISVWTGKDGVKVAGVIPNSPAEVIGLQSGDLIISANGKELASVDPDLQVSYIRGEAGTSINLVIDRNGQIFSVSTKRAELSVQGLDAQDISNWYGKNQGLTAEEIAHLATQKIPEGYELLGVTQYGMPIVRSAENLNANAVQQISIKKIEEAKFQEVKQTQNTPDMSLSSKVENASLVNVKGAHVKKQGNVQVYRKLK